LSLVPYFFLKKNFLFTKFFWLGLLIGFIPFLFWTFSINSFLDKNIIFYLVEKFNFLSSKNTFTNPFYYYFWNVPITFLPWSFFAIIGTIYNISQSKENKYILTFFPIILIAILSIFSTKTPYYPLQISSIFALNSYVGIRFFFNSKKYGQILLLIFSKIVPLFIFALTFTYYFFLKDTLNFNFKENTCLILGLLLFGFSWSLIKHQNSFKKIVIFLIIGPYLLTSFLLQSGLFTDRSRELREKMEYVSSLDIVKNQTIMVDKKGINNSQSQSKIIRISLLTPKLGEGIESIYQLKKSELAWTTDLKKIKENDKSFEVIYENDILKPWKLILKK
jgi:hypothetical protein